MLRLLRRIRMHLDAFVAGAAMSWVLVPQAIALRREMERILALETAALAAGVPLLPPTLNLRLLPHLVPVLLTWRRQSIFERELEGADLRHIGH